jgi:signal transduction histidine kinase
VRRASAEAEAALYFSASEAITNALKHAAPAVVKVTVTNPGDRIVVHVADDGPGGADSAGSGLLGIRDRLASVDGTVTIDTRLDQGTVLTLEAPCG